MFVGYEKRVVDYFLALEANNQKDWFDANRADFDHLVMEPSVALVSALQPRLADLSLPLMAEPKLNGSIRRVYRDTRFSADKTPYQTHLHLIFWAGSHPNRSAGVHIIIGKDGFGSGAGQWALEKDHLMRLRQGILDDGGAQLDKIVSDLSAFGIALDPPQLKRVPREFDAEAKGAEYLKYKGFVAKSGSSPLPQEMLGPEGVEYIVELCERYAAFNAFIHQYV